jgi:hypothetical protein
VSSSNGADKNPNGTTKKQNPNIYIHFKRKAPTKNKEKNKLCIEVLSRKVA